MTISDTDPDHSGGTDVVVPAVGESTTQTADRASGKQAEIPELIPARMVNQYAYCPRLFYLEWVERQWADNEHTEQGEFSHRRVDKPIGDLDPERPARATSVAISSDRLGLTAVIDLVESDGITVAPIDYKKGSPPTAEQLAHQPYPVNQAGPDGVNPPLAWYADQMQVTVQALLLRDNGYRVERFELYYAETRTRVRVPFTTELETEAHRVITEMRSAASSLTKPDPLVDSPKCPGCSLVGICLPDEINQLNGDVERPTRRYLARDPDARPLHVVEQGAFVGKKGFRVEVRKGGELLTSQRLLDVSAVSLHGNVSISAQLIRELSDRESPVAWFSYGGWFNAMTTAGWAGNVELRRRQFTIDSDLRLSAARWIVAGKVKNCRTFLRRHGSTADRSALRNLKKCVDQALSASDTSQLLGIEGNAARVYFRGLGRVLEREMEPDRQRQPGGDAGHPTGDDDPFAEQPIEVESADENPIDTASDVNPFKGDLRSFERRSRRPPQDPINCVLSFLYGQIVRDITAAGHVVGLDPYEGVFHRPRFGRPALSLDLAEEFRPIVGDSTMLRLFNNGELREGHFVRRNSGVALTADGRRKVIGAYERRLEQSIQHPIFGYSVTYRRLYELQLRLFAAWLMGEVDEYVPFTTR